MSNTTFRTMLVVGEDHAEKVKKYSLDTKVEKHLFAKREDAETLRQKKIELIEQTLKHPTLPLTDKQRSIYETELTMYDSMDDVEYFEFYTDGCTYDDNGDAWIDTNPLARYQYEKCQQKLLEKYKEESAFSDPFKLKDGTVSYIAKKGDIDWSLMHLANTNLYERAWEIVVDGDKPKNETEERIEFAMSNRKQYFENFANKEEYVKHSCSFWTYAIVDNDGVYDECGLDKNDKNWITGFYDKFIKELSDDTVLSIYEIKTI